MALNTDQSSISAEHNSSRDMTLSSTSNPGLRPTSAQATPSARKLVLSLALLVLFTSSLLLFLTFASITGTWCQVNNNGNSGNSSNDNDNFKSMTVSELLNANLGAIAEVTCVLVAPDQCLPLVEVNLATLFVIDIQQQQQQNLAVVDKYKKNNNSNSSSCQLISIIQNLCVNRQNDQFKVVSVFLFKQKKSKQTN